MNLFIFYVYNIHRFQSQQKIDLIEQKICIVTALIYSHYHLIKKYASFSLTFTSQCVMRVTAETSLRVETSMVYPHIYPHNAFEGNNDNVDNVDERFLIVCCTSSIFRRFLRYSLR